MEGLPAQQPIDPQHPEEKATPDPNTDFGDEAFNYDAMPQKRISAGGLNEWIFGLMRPKTKTPAKVPVKQATAHQRLENPLSITKHLPPPPTPAPETGVYDENRGAFLPAGYAVENGLLIQKKSLAERVRDQIKFPVLKSTQSLINGAALIIFAVGAGILYSALPTRPELVIGILLVAIAGNIITSNR